MPIDKQLLKDYVATATSGKYKTWDEIDSKFPELVGYDKQLLKDYVATASSGKYGSWDEINSKFPEFEFDKKKDGTQPSSESVTQPTKPSEKPLEEQEIQLSQLEGDKKVEFDASTLDLEALQKNITIDPLEGDISRYWEGQKQKALLSDNKEQSERDVQFYEQMKQAGIETVREDKIKREAEVDPEVHKNYYSGKIDEDVRDINQSRIEEGKAPINRAKLIKDREASEYGAFLTEDEDKESYGWKTRLEQIDQDIENIDEQFITNPALASLSEEDKEKVKKAQILALNKEWEETNEKLEEFERNRINRIDNDIAKYSVMMMDETDEEEKAIIAERIGLLSAQKEKFFKDIDENTKDLVESTGGTITQGVKSNKETFNEYYDNLYQEYKELGEDPEVRRFYSESGVVSEVKAALMSVTGMPKNITRYAMLHNKLQEYSTIRLLNRYTKGETESLGYGGEFVERFGESFISGMTNVMTSFDKKLQLQNAQELASTMIDLGIPLNENIKISAKVGKDGQFGEYGLTDPEYWGDLGGTSTGIGFMMAGTRGLSANTLKVLNIEKGLVNLSKMPLFGKLLKPKVMKAVAEHLSSGVEYQVAGLVFRNASDELNFLSGLFGRGGSMAVESLLKKGNKIFGKTFSKFFSDTALERIKQSVITKGLKWTTGRAGGSAGEVGEEFAQELSDIFQSDNEGFFKELDNRFGTLEKTSKFIISSGVMGFFMGGGTSVNVASQEAFVKAYTELKQNNPKEAEKISKILQEFGSEFSQAYESSIDENKKAYSESGEQGFFIGDKEVTKEEALEKINTAETQEDLSTLNIFNADEDVQKAFDSKFKELNPITESTTEEPTKEKEEFEAGETVELEPTVTDDVEVEEEVKDYSKESEENLEKRMSEIENSKDPKDNKEFNSIESELQQREWDSVMQKPLEEVEGQLDELSKKDKEMPNGFGSFIEPEDILSSKEVVEKYSDENKGEITNEELKKDFKDSFMGNPTTSYSDGLRLRESFNELSNRGYNVDDIINEVRQEFIKDGYTEDVANTVINAISKRTFGVQKEQKTLKEPKKPGVKISSDKEILKNRTKDEKERGVVSFYHGGLSENSTIDSIDLTRRASKQQKKGRDFGGFYMNNSSQKSDSERYAKGGGALHKIEMNEDARILDIDANIERISREDLESYKKQGYDVLKGKNVWGKSEYILLSKDNIKDFKLEKTEAQVKKGEPAPGTFYTTLKEGKLIKKEISGEVSKEKIEGRDFIVSKIDGNWTVTDPESGINISSASKDNSKEGVIKEAKDVVDRVGGLDKLDSLIAKKLSESSGVKGKSKKTTPKKKLSKEKQAKKEKYKAKKPTPKKKPTKEEYKTKKPIKPKVIKTQNISDANDLVKKASNETQKKALSRVANVIKSLVKLDPNTSVSVHEDQESYKQAVIQAGGTENDANTSGFYEGKDGSIHMNMEQVKDNTILHEATHKVMASYLKRNPKALSEFRKQLDKPDLITPAERESLEKFVSGYKNKTLQDEEFVTEFIARVASGEIDLSKASKSRVQYIANILKKLAKKIGLDPNSIKLTGKEDVVDFAKKLSEAFSEGKEIDIINSTQEKLMNNEPYSEGEQGFIREDAPLKPKYQVNKLGDYADIDFAKSLPIKTLKEIVEKYEGRVFFTTSDATGLGYDKSGDEILGGIGYISIEENVNGNIGFASIDSKTANSSLSTMWNRFGGGKPIAVIVMVQNPSATLGNYYGGKYFGRGLLSLKKNYPSKYDEVVKSFEKYISSTNKVKKALDKNKTTNALIELVKNVDKYSESDFAKEWAKDTTFDVRREIIKSLVIDNENVGTNESTPLIKKLLKDQGFNKVDFLDEYADPSLKPLFENDEGGFLVGGFELTLPIEKEGVKKMVQDHENNGITHHLFNGKIPKTGDSFYLDGLYDVQENFKGFAKQQTEITKDEQLRSEVDAIARKVFKSETDYAKEFRASGSKKVPKSRRGYKHLTPDKKMKLKNILSERLPESLIERTPQISADVARGMGFAPDIEKESELVEADFERRVKYQKPTSEDEKVVQDYINEMATDDVLDLFTAEEIHQDFIDNGYDVSLDKVKEFVKEASSPKTTKEVKVGKTTKEKQVPVEHKVIEHSEGLMRDVMDLKLTKQEVQKIVQENDIDEIFDLLKDSKAKEKMNDSTYLALLAETGMALNKKGDTARAREIWDMFADVASQAGKTLRMVRFVANNPLVMTRVVMSRINKTANEKLNQVTTNGKTVSSNIEAGWDKLKDVAKNLGVIISENDSLDSALDKIVTKIEKKGRSISKSISRANNNVDKLFNEFKSNSPKFQKPDSDTEFEEFDVLNPREMRLAINVAKEYIKTGKVESIDDVIEMVKEKFKTNLDRDIPQSSLNEIRNEIKKIPINKALKNAKKEIKNVIKEHVSKKDTLKRSLAEKLIDQLGIDGEEAKEVEELFNETFEKELEVQITKKLALAFGASLVPEPEKSSSQYANRITEAVNMGGFNNEFYKELVAEKLGIPILTQEQQDKINDFADALLELPEGSLRSRALRDMQTYINNVKSKATGQLIAETLIELFYTNTLSGITTLARALKGGILTASSEVVMKSLSTIISKNPIKGAKAVSIALKHMAKGMGVGAKNWTSVLSDGYSDAELFEVNPGYKSRIDQIVDSSYAEIRKSDKSIPRKAWESFIKTMFYIPKKMYRVIIANDAVMRMGLKEFASVIEAYNNELAINKEEANFFTNLNNKLAIDADSKASVDEKLKIEKAQLLASGVKLPSNYDNIRRYEIRDEMREQHYHDLNVNANEWAKTAMLMNDPTGLLGKFYDSMSAATTIKESDANALKMIKLMGKFIGFPFLRVSTNFMNMVVKSTPGLATGNTILWRYMNKEVGIGLRSSDPVEKRKAQQQLKDRVFRALMSTSLFAGLALALFEGDEYDEDDPKTLWGLVPSKLKLRDDAPFEFTGSGTGDYNSNQTLAKGYKSYSFRYRNSNGEWSDFYSYVDNPWGGLFAMLGGVSDAIKIKRANVESGGHTPEKLGFPQLLTSSKYAIMFLTEQSYSQGLNNLTRLIGSKNPAADVAKAIARPARGLVEPNIYKQITQQIDAYNNVGGKGVSYSDDTWETLTQIMTRDIPLMEDINNGYNYDLFGNKIIKKFEIPLVPDYLLDMVKQNRDYRESDPAWKILHKFEAYYTPQKLSIKKQQFRDFKTAIGKDVSFSDYEETYRRIHGGYRKEEFLKLYDMGMKRSDGTVVYGVDWTLKDIKTAMSKASGKATENTKEAIVYEF